MRLLLCGGGTAGHVLPHIAVLDELRKREKRVEVLYVGSRNGPEATYAREWGIPFQSVPTGKWRRYFDGRNLTDPFKVGAGVLKSLFIVKKFKPDVLFSKGGFASVPVLLAGRLLRVPIVIHDSDALPGLTTRLAAPWADTICLGSEAAVNRLPKRVRKKIMVTGIPIRPEILTGSAKTGRTLADFTRGKPIVLVMGGSLGAEALNRAVVHALPKLTRVAQILHITGQGKSAHAATERYRPYEYVGPELPHFLAMADLVVSRAGANALAELETLGKPMILVPLAENTSHGDQVINAALLKERGAARVILNAELDGARLADEVADLLKSPDRLGEMAKRAKSEKHEKAAAKVAEILAGIVSK